MYRGAPHFGPQGHMQRSRSSGNNYHHHVDNSVHDNSSTHYGDSFSTVNHNMSGTTLNIAGTIGNANFGANHGWISQSSGGTVCSPPPHHDRGPINPFQHAGQWHNPSHGPPSQDSDYWGHPYYGPQAVQQQRSRGSDQFFEQKEVHVHSTSVRQASNNPFRTSVPVERAEQAAPRSPTPPSRSSSSHNGGYIDGPTQPSRRRPPSPTPPPTKSARDLSHYAPTPERRPSPDGPADGPKSRESKADVAPRRPRSGSHSAKIVIQRLPPAETDTDADIEEAKKVARRDEARGKNKLRGHRIAKEVSANTSRKVEKDLGQAEREPAPTMEEDRPRPTQKGSARAPPARRTGFETTTDEEDGEPSSGYAFSILDCDSKPEPKSVQPSASASTSKGKGREIEESVFVSSGTARSNSAEVGPRQRPQSIPNDKVSSKVEEAQRKPEVKKSYASSVTSDRSSIPGIEVESDTDAVVLNPSSLFSDGDISLLFTPIEELPWSNVRGPSEASAPPLAPPQYTPDPLTPSASTSGDPVHADGASNPLDSMVASTSNLSIANDVSGDLLVAGTSKPPKKSVFGGLKRALKVKTTKEKNVAPEGGVVGATGVQDSDD